MSFHGHTNPGPNVRHCPECDEHHMRELCKVKLDLRDGEIMTGKHYRIRVECMRGHTLFVEDVVC